jgi:hypothetical protein
MLFFASQVHGTRFTDKYLQTRQSYSRGSFTSYPYSPPLPARTPTKRGPSPSVGSPGSPPRKVVSDFAAFGARPNASVFGTAVASTPFSLAGGKAAFGGMRGGCSMFDADEEDEDDQRRQRVELREDTISLEQVLHSLIYVVKLLSIYCRRGVLHYRVLGEAPMHERSCFPFDSHKRRLLFHLFF